MTRTHRIRSTVAAAVLAASTITPLAMSTPAQAQGYGWNYISLPTWLGNCPNGGSVKYLKVSVGDTWSGGDYGDDLVYAKVVIGADQDVVSEGLCYNGSKSYWGPASYQTIHPTRGGQTWWVGPYGVRHN